MGAVGDPSEFQLAATPPRRGTAAVALLYAPTESGDILRRLQRWKRAGAEAGKPAPLGDPVAMVEWYAEMRRAGHFKQICPDILLDAAARHSRPPASAELPAAAQPVALDPAPAPVTPPTAPPPSPPAGHLPAEDLTPKRRLERLEEEEARLHRRYLEVLAAKGTDAELDVHRTRWSEMSTLVVQTRQRLANSKDLLDPAEVNSALPAVLSALMQAVVKELSFEFPGEKVIAAAKRAWERAPANVAQLLAT